MIYSKFDNKPWKLHHYQPETSQEQIELVYWLRSNYPLITWVYIEYFKNVTKEVTKER